jgi:hypothetical protein
MASCPDSATTWDSALASRARSAASRSLPSASAARRALFSASRASLSVSTSARPFSSTSRSVSRQADSSRSAACAAAAEAALLSTTDRARLPRDSPCSISRSRSSLRSAVSSVCSASMTSRRTSPLPTDTAEGKAGGAGGRDAAPFPEGTTPRNNIPPEGKGAGLLLDCFMK